MYVYEKKKKQCLQHLKPNNTLVQRIKIRLDDTIPAAHSVLERLEQFNFPNQGAAIINANTLAGAGHRSNVMIGRDENIILMGHGIRPWGAPPGHGDAAAQAGYDANSLAGVADAVNKPLDWNGCILLAGCNTAGLAEAVSQEYYTRSSFNRAVKVTGTNYKISVRDVIGGSFIGSDWSDLDVADRPANYNADFIRLRDQCGASLAVALTAISDYINDCANGTASMATIATVQAHDNGLAAIQALVPVPTAVPVVQDAVNLVGDIRNYIALIVANNNQNQTTFANAHQASVQASMLTMPNIYRNLDDYVQVHVDLANPANTPSMAVASKRRKRFILFGPWVDV